MVTGVVEFRLTSPALMITLLAVTGPERVTLPEIKRRVSRVTRLKTPPFSWLIVPPLPKLLAFTWIVAPATSGAMVPKLVTDTSCGPPIRGLNPIVAEAGWDEPPRTVMPEPR